jgi:hypothetical protein
MWRAIDCHGDFGEFGNLLLDKNLGIFYKTLLRLFIFFSIVENIQ